MQNSIIDEILRIEGDAKRTVDEAEKKAEEIVIQAEDRARETVRKAQEDEKRSADALVLAAEKKSEETLRAIKEQSSDKDSLDPKKEEAYERALDRAVRRVLDI